MKRSSVVTALVVASALSASGCYGSYGAFNKVHKWNGQATGSKLANSAIHLGLYILPVYPIVYLGDFLIFNTVEFITGEPVFR